MSYQSRRPSQYVRRPMGGFLDDAVDFFARGGDTGSQNFLDSNCKQFAAIAPEVKQRDLQIADVRANWNPTGFYTVDQFSQIMVLTRRMTESTTDAITKMLGQSQLNAHRELLTQAINSVHKAIGTGALAADPLEEYSRALLIARTQGKEVIEAQGLKRTILNVMTTVRDAVETYEMVKCARPPSLNFIEKALSAFTALYNFLKTVVGVAIDIAKTLGRAVAAIPDTLGTLFTVLKWSALLGGAYFIGAKAGIIPATYDPLGLGK